MYLCISCTLKISVITWLLNNEPDDDHNNENHIYIIYIYTCTYNKENPVSFLLFHNKFHKSIPTTIRIMIIINIMNSYHRSKLPTSSAMYHLPLAPSSLSAKIRRSWSNWKLLFCYTHLHRNNKETSKIRQTIMIYL